MSKRSDQLFGFLVDISQNVCQAVEVFEQSLKDLSHPEAIAIKVKEYERKGDELTSSLASLVNATYITPLDREDFLELALKMDDILDGLEACTVRFDLFNITSATPVMMDFAENIKSSVLELSQALQKLNERKLLDIRDHTVKVNQLEKTGDMILRKALRVLFQEHQDPLEVIKLKEIYEILETITDRCEDVADVLDSVIVKNA
jgi:predicted phosphate transport protein (TIGR00153 family)